MFGRVSPEASPVHLIQARLSSATPSEWVDAIVESTDARVGVRHAHSHAHLARRFTCPSHASALSGAA